MDRYRYLIVGGGMTADAAVEGIRSLDPDGAIGLIGGERHPPYDRPPLSKGLWHDTPEAKIWRGTAERGADLRLGRRVVSLDLQARRAVDDTGGVVEFDRLLLATGGAPRRLPFGGDDIVYFRTLDDFHRLRAASAEGRRFAVVGGGFIGFEIAAALATTGAKVTMLFPEREVGARLFPAALARAVTGTYRERGVEVLSRHEVVAVERRGDSLTVRARPLSGADPRTVEVDTVVAGIGIHPETALAEAAGLEVGDGIHVDGRLRTSAPGVWAAGDVASTLNPVTGERWRVEHEDNALSTGRAAGRGMAGDDAPYDHIPFFYSDLFEAGFEAVGELDASAETVADWQEPEQKGVVYYLRGDRVRGVLLWNVWERVDAARALLREDRPTRARDLVGRLS